MTGGSSGWTPLPSSWLPVSGRELVGGARTHGLWRRGSQAGQSVGLGLGLLKGLRGLMIACGGAPCKAEGWCQASSQRELRQPGLLPCSLIALSVLSHWSLFAGLRLGWVTAHPA